MVVEEKGQDGSSYQQMIYDGEGVNKLIVDRVISPLNSISPDVYEFLQTVQSSPISRVLNDLASDGMINQFKAAVESYGKDGYYQDVVSGTETGLAALQEWVANFKASGGDRSPFDTLETELSNFMQS